VGLIQRAAEEAGFFTISMGNEPERMEKIKPPRALRVRFGRGSMFGEPGNVARQRQVVLDCLEALATMDTPGTIRELPYAWRR
jgi:hypothetical protein